MNRNIYFGFLAGSILLASCKSTNSKSSDPLALRPSDRATELHKKLVLDLATQFGPAEDTVWFESTMGVGQDWLIESPEGYWGKAAADLPKNLECQVGEQGCDEQFTRHICSEDADCANYNTTCQVLEASVTGPNQVAKKMCLGSGDQLLNRFYRAIVATKVHVDIVSLSIPTKRFYQMLVNALAFLSHKNPIPTVRILTAGKESRKLNDANLPGSVIAEILPHIEKQGGDINNLYFDLGYLALKGLGLSWNHSKIILVDDDLVISGGHNMYDPDYLNDQPIFNLSMEFRGPAAGKTRKFVNELWANVGPYWDDNPDCISYLKWLNDRFFKSISDECRAKRSYPKGQSPIENPSLGQLPVPQMLSKTAGTVRMIGVGRLGDIKSEALGGENINPSDLSIQSLIRHARKSVYIAQEDMFSKIPVAVVSRVQGLLKKGDSPALPTLVNAMIDNDITVKIVQTDQVSPDNPDGYGMVSPAEAKARILAAVVAQATAKRKVILGGRSYAKYYCEKLEVAPWRFTKDVSRWADGKTRIGSHPKLIVTDETAFYLGSHNFYPANLQEFGVIVTEESLTADLLGRYWNKLWDASEPAKLSCDRPDAELTSFTGP